MMGGIPLKKTLTNMIITYILVAIPLSVFLYVIIEYFYQDSLTKNQVNGLEIITLTFLNIGLGALSVFFWLGKENKERLALTSVVADNTNQSVLITDSANKIIYANPAFYLMSGYSKVETIGENPSFLKSGRHSKAFYQTMWRSIEEFGFWEGEIWDKKKNGTLYPKKMTIQVLRDKKNRIKYHVGLHEDLTEILKKEEDIYQATHYSHGTNLPNANLLIKLLQNSITDEEHPFYVLYGGIKNRAYIESILEDGKYNKAMIALTTLFKSLIPIDALVAELDKDTLCIVVPQSDTDITLIAKTLVDSAKNFMLDHLIPFDIRFGVSSYPKDATNAKNLIQYAHIAQAFVSKSHSQYVGFYLPEYSTVIANELKLEQALSQAVIKNELSLHYQMQVDAKTGKLRGVEALMRWHNEELGNISPSIFIEVAEQKGYIHALGDYLISQIKEDYPKLSPNHDLIVSINTSARQLEDERWAERIKDLVVSKVIEPANIEIELTESAMIADQEKTEAYIKTLKDLGVRIAVDDFGIGFTSLRLLEHLPINTIKIDQSFVKTYPNSQGNIAKSIIGIASNLGLTVVAEGVETDMQRQFLLDNHCHYHQGYLYSKPLPLNEFVKKTQERNHL